MIVTFYCEDSQEYRQQLDEEKSCTVSIMGLSRSRCNICLYPYLISPATQKKCRGSLSHCDFGDPQTSPLAHQQHAQSNLHQWQLVHAEAVASGPPHPYAYVQATTTGLLAKWSESGGCKWSPWYPWLFCTTSSPNDSLLHVFQPPTKSDLNISEQKWTIIGDPMLPASPQNEYGSPWQPSVHTKI